MKKILISGDSWSFAVYNPIGDDYSIMPQAFGHQLSDQGYNITNVSSAGASNSATIRCIDQALELDNSYDVVLWVQTDPFRDLRFKHSVEVPIFGNVPAYNMDTVHQLVTVNNNSLVKSAEMILAGSYHRLNMIAKKYKRDIYCIGGCVPISNFVYNFNNLAVLIRSIPELLIPGFEESFVYDTEGWLTYQYVEYAKKNKIRLEDTDWYQCTDTFMTKSIVWSNCLEYFSPDQWHPNVKGHAVIADFIVKTLGLE